MKCLCAPFTKHLSEYYSSLSDNRYSFWGHREHEIWLKLRVGGRERDGRGKHWHIHPNLTPPLATLKRLHCGARHCPTPSRQSLFRWANSAPWKDCKNKRWMSKAKVNKISVPSFVEPVRYAQTHPCVTEKKGRPCEVGSRKKLERLCMKRPIPWEVSCLSRGSIENPPHKFLDETLAGTHRGHLNTRW